MMVTQLSEVFQNLPEDDTEEVNRLLEQSENYVCDWRIGTNLLERIWIQVN